MDDRAASLSANCEIAYEGISKSKAVLLSAVPVQLESGLLADGLRQADF